MIPAFSDSRRRGLRHNQLPISTLLEELTYQPYKPPNCITLMKMLGRSGDRISP